MSLRAFYNTVSPVGFSAIEAQVRSDLSHLPEIEIERSNFVSQLFLESIDITETLTRLSIVEAVHKTLETSFANRNYSQLTELLDQHSPGARALFESGLAEAEQSALDGLEDASSGFGWHILGGMVGLLQSFGDFILDTLSSATSPIRTAYNAIEGAWGTFETFSHAAFNVDGTVAAANQQAAQIANAANAIIETFINGLSDLREGNFRQAFDTMASQYAGWLNELSAGYEPFSDLYDTAVGASNYSELLSLLAGADSADEMIELVMGVHTQTEFAGSNVIIDSVTDVYEVLFQVAKLYKLMEEAASLEDLASSFVGEEYNQRFIDASLRVKNYEFWDASTQFFEFVADKLPSPAVSLVLSGVANAAEVIFEYFQIDSISRIVAPVAQYYEDALPVYQQYFSELDTVISDNLNRTGNDWGTSLFLRHASPNAGETIYGSSFGDELQGTQQADLFYAGDSNDRVFGNGGNDSIRGEGHNDELFGGTDNDTLRGDDGLDTLFGELGEDELFGGNDNDTLRGGADNDTLDGESGSQDLAVYQYGFEGHYVLTDTGSGTYTVQALTGSEGTDTLAGIERIQFGDANRSIEDWLSLQGGDASAPNTPAPLPPIAIPTAMPASNSLLSVVPVNRSVAPGESVAIADLFPQDNWQDNDGSYDIEWVTLQDRSAGGGFLTRNGETVLANTVYTIAVSDLTYWAFVGANSAASDEIGFNIVQADGSYSPRLSPGSIVTTVLPGQGLRPVDDHGDSISDATVLSDNTVTSYVSTSGMIGEAGDEDWFSVQLQRGQAYAFTLWPNTVANSLLDPYLSLRLPNGSTQSNDNLSATTLMSYLSFTPSSSGTYFLGASGEGNSIGDYVLSVTPVSRDSSADALRGTSSQQDSGNTSSWHWEGDSDDNYPSDLALETGGRPSTTSNNRYRGHNGDDTIRADRGNDVVWGDRGDDRLHGEDGNDTLRGGDHEDTLYGDDGNDLLYGEEGDDSIRGGEGQDTLYGGEDEDTLKGQDGDDYLKGEDGHDSLEGGDGDDQLYGDEGHDTIEGDDGDDFIMGGDGHDSLEGDDGEDRLAGEDGDDTLEGDDGDDLLYGGQDDDLLQGGEGNDILHGESGNDTADFSDGRDGIQVNLFDEISISTDLGVDRLYDINNVVGSRGDDVIDGDHSANLLDGNNDDDNIRGHNGDDTLLGGSDDDTLWGDEGVDSLDGGSGRDHLRGGLGNDLLLGGTGDDTLRGEQGNDTINGGEGQDTAFFWGEREDFDVSLSGDGVTIRDKRNDGLEGADYVESVEFFEFFDGTIARADLFASAPTLQSDIASTNTLTPIVIDVFENDLLGSQSADLTDIQVISGQGTAYISSGRIIYDPRLSFDNMSIGEQTTVILNYAMRNSALFTATSTVEIQVTSTPRILDGGSSDDTLIGSPAPDSLSGSGGDDEIFGAGGNDTLNGGDGADTLDAGNGDDRLLGGAGEDTLDGGEGTDTAVFEFDTPAGVIVDAENFYITSDGETDTATRQIEFFEFSDGTLTNQELLQLTASAPFGAVEVEGEAIEGQTLSADTTTIADANGLGSFSYQWLRDGMEIADEIGETYVLKQADVGKGISLRVSFVDGIGTLENVISTATDAVVNTNDPVRGLPVIIGTIEQGETLTVDLSGVSDEDGLGTLLYQWLRDESAISDATSASYVLEQNDVGAEVSVSVSYVDGYGVSETIDSTKTAPVSNINDEVTGGVRISGSPFQGQTLNADLSGLSDEDGLGDFSYQWLRGDEGIAGATSETYVLGQEDVGEEISVRVSYIDGFGTTEGSTSSALAVDNVNDPVQGDVLISGIALEGETLTADASGLSDPDGLGAFNFQWLRNGNVIAEETSATYQLAQVDTGASVSVRVSFIDGQGTTETLQSNQISDILPLAVDIVGTETNERISGTTGDDTLNGGDGTDTLIGGEGNDTLIGGDSEDDLRDVIYGGDGDDSIDGGYGNDELRGDAGNDTIAGGFGADTVIGGTGDDTLTGSAFGDQIFGGDGNDFINGGWGYDLVNGGAGGDRFFHIGIADHGSDWIQDYNAAEGDVLQFGIATATISQFQVNTTHTATAAGERSGDDNVEEAFVIYRPTGQIMWALVDGAGQASINLQIGQDVFDLMG
ncbi:hypothetical protein Q4525_20180 [Shimia thalassica]|uniref:hypothetical protein n=1 Tax=Shimia thalassica TaxID=1715693 RepID=UPI001C0972EE|nr:hypothetical protein [Shimia thalassica]MBU2941050.1 hypothetical protein [Shimia thalassica]MDO6505261.1 hypothetical protein [Shimia thalassica]